MKSPRHATLLAVFLLASCGGGGGGSDGGSVGVVPGPTGTPSPTPSTSPSPTPSATPTFAYDIAFDFTRDRLIPLIGAQIITVATDSGGRLLYNPIAASLIEATAVGTLRYEGASQQASIGLFNAAPQSYPGSQITLRQADRLTYEAPSGFLSIGQPGPSLGSLPAPLRYTVVAVQTVATREPSGQTNIIERRLVGGASTVAADVPRSGTAPYRVLAAAVSYAPNSLNGFVAQNVDLSVDYATRDVRGTITLASTVTSLPATTVTLTIAGQISDTSNRIAGSVTSSDGGTGRLTGELYGPQGGELGIGFTLLRSGDQLAGTIVGARR